MEKEGYRRFAMWAMKKKGKIEGFEKNKDEDKCEEWATEEKRKKKGWKKGREA